MNSFINENLKIALAIPHQWLSQVVEKIFAAAQVDCVNVENIEELYEMLSQERIDLVILDVFSYPRYFRHILTQIKEIEPGISILALVSTNEASYQYELLTAGAAAVV
ncbi:MAG: response regulator transcription factor, partial [Syntrophomonadaceae bacterium]|nr:response regulator transcription factor [Syntrophomonadaceae bacterium]